MKCEFNCPHCFETNVFDFYPEDGRDQDTILDCEVCCKPVEVHVNFRFPDNPEVQTKKSE